jgi:hypothetical protein
LIQHLWGKSYYSLIFTTRIIYISSLYLMALAIILVQVQTQPLALSLRMRVVALELHLTAYERKLISSGLCCNRKNSQIVNVMA